MYYILFNFFSVIYIITYSQFFKVRGRLRFIPKVAIISVLFVFCCCDKHPSKKQLREDIGLYSLQIIVPQWGSLGRGSRQELGDRK